MDLHHGVARAHGVARVVDDRDWLRAMLGRLGDVPADHLERMMRAIVGNEIPIDRLAGKRKASQDEDLPDRLGTVQGLRTEAGDAARAMADIVQQAIEAEAGRPPAGQAGTGAPPGRVKRR
jgi:transcriptional regulator